MLAVVESMKISIILDESAAEMLNPIESEQAPRRRKLLLLGHLTEHLERRCQLLENHGYQVTVADTLSSIRSQAELQAFDSVVCDDSVSPLEQQALSQVIRLRYPWMQILRLHSDLHSSDIPSLSSPDGSAEAESGIPTGMMQVLLD